jgi:hypothetical protein
VLRHSVVTDLLRRVPRPGELLTRALSSVRRARANGSGTAVAAPAPPRG